MVRTHGYNTFSTSSGTLDATSTVCTTITTSSTTSSTTSASATATKLLWNAMGTNESRDLERTGDCGCTSFNWNQEASNPFAGTFQSANPFIPYGNQPASSSNQPPHPFVPHAPPANFAYSFGSPQPSTMMQNQGLVIDRSASPCFQPANEFKPNLPPTQHPFVQSQFASAPTAATPGNSGFGQSQGVTIDRTQASEFQPPEHQGCSSNPYAHSRSLHNICRATLAKPCFRHLAIQLLQQMPLLSLMPLFKQPYP